MQRRTPTRSPCLVPVPSADNTAGIPTRSEGAGRIPLTPPADASSRRWVGLASTRCPLLSSRRTRAQSDPSRVLVWVVCQEPFARSRHLLV